MSRPPRPSRREFLAGVGLVGTAALAGCTTVYSALPDRISYLRTRQRGIPGVPPAVETTDAHLQEVADEIADYAADGLEAWNRMGERERFVVYTEGRLEDAAAFADELPSKSPTPDTLGSARYNLSRAAGGLAYAQVRTDEFDGDPSAGADEWLETAADRRDEFAYETDDPATFLAYGRFVERSLRQATLSLSRNADAEVDVDDERERSSRAERVADIYGGVRVGRLRVRSAAAYREALRERDSGGDPFGDAMADSRATLHDRIDDLLADREDWRDRIGGLEGERCTVHDALYSRSHRGESGSRDADRYVDDDYEVYGTVDLAEAWLLLAAASSERDRIEAADDDRLDSGAIDAAKRDAVERLEDVLADDPDPLALFFADEARSLIYFGDRGLERSSLDDDEDWRWSQANGYARYLLASGVLERTDDAVGVLVDR